MNEADTCRRYDGRRALWERRLAAMEGEHCGSGADAKEKISSGSEAER